MNPNKKSKNLCSLVSLILPVLLLLLAFSQQDAWAGAKQFVVEFDEGAPPYGDLPLKTIKPQQVSASSSLKSKNGEYDPKKTSDDKAATAWCEGKDGNGTGEWILYEFGKSVPITVINFTPFYAKNQSTLANNNRIKKMKIEMEGTEGGTIEFPDASWCNDCQLQYPAPFINFYENNRKRFVKTSWVKFTIIEVFQGRKFNDTCISDIIFQAWSGK